MEARPRCGIAGPQLLYPGGEWQPSRRRFPTVLGTLVRRTPLRWLFDPKRAQRRHYLLDERPAEPMEADWMLGAFLLLRREMLEELGGFDEGFRLYGEDIDLCYRAALAGWERWYVPAAVVEHAYAAEIDRRCATIAEYRRLIDTEEAEVPSLLARQGIHDVTERDDLGLVHFVRVPFGDERRRPRGEQVLHPVGAGSVGEGDHESVVGGERPDRSLVDPARPMTYMTDDAGVRPGCACRLHLDRVHEPAVEPSDRPQNHRRLGPHPEHEGE